MSDQSPSAPPPTVGLAPGADVTSDSTIAFRKKKEKRKLRSAWISFVSRILAQFVGSAATIVLGLMFLQKYHAISRDAAERADESSPTVASAPAPTRERAGPGRLTVAVLPLDNYSGDPKQDHLANAMTEALITALSQVEGLRVVSRTSSMHYKGASKPLPEIARELAVDWIVEGSVVSGSGRVRVIGQLIDTSSDEHVWAASYDRRFQDALSLQTGLASVIARDVDSAIARGNDRQPARSRADERFRDNLDQSSPESADPSGTNVRP